MEEAKEKIYLRIRSFIVFKAKTVFCLHLYKPDLISTILHMLKLIKLREELYTSEIVTRFLSTKPSLLTCKRLFLYKIR